MSLRHEELLSGTLVPTAQNPPARGSCTAVSLPSQHVTGDVAISLVPSSACLVFVKDFSERLFHDLREFYQVREFSFLKKISLSIC